MTLQKVKKKCLRFISSFLANTPHIDEIFNNKSNIDIKQITNDYYQNFGNSSSQIKPYEKQNLDNLMGSHFDYNKVNEYIDAGKSNVQKDHFSFVNDLLKKK